MVLLSDTVKSAAALDVKVTNHLHHSSILKTWGKEHEDQDLVDFGVRLEEQVNASKKAN